MSATKAAWEGGRAVLRTASIHRRQAQSPQGMSQTTRADERKAPVPSMLTPPARLVSLRVNNIPSSFNVMIPFPRNFESADTELELWRDTKSQELSRGAVKTSDPMVRTRMIYFDVRDFPRENTLGIAVHGAPGRRLHETTPSRK